MHVLIGLAIVSGAIWLAIEQPKFRKALWITGAICVGLVAGAALLLMSRP